MARFPQMERSARIQPQATPVNTYVRPPDPPRSNLHQLADALSSLGSDLASLVEQRKEEHRKAELLRGEAAFYRATQEGEARGIREGSIPTYASPYFVRGYKRAQGRLAGQQLFQKFHAEYLTWDGKDRASQEEFDGFLGEFVKRNVTTDDPDVLLGLLPEVRRLQDHGYAQFAKDLDAKLYDENLKTRSAIAGQTIDERLLNGLKEKAGTDYKGLGDELLAMRREAIKTGIRADDFDKQYVDLITAKALEHKDHQLLGLLDQKVPGGKVSFADTPYGRDQKQKTVQALEVIARRETREIEDERKDEATRQAIELLAANPGKALPEELLRFGIKYDPEFRTNVLKWQKQLAEGTVAEDPQKITALTARILNGEGGVIRQGLRNGTIRSAATLQQLSQFEKAMRDGQGRFTKVLQGHTFTSMLNTIRERTTLPEQFNFGVDPGGLSDAGLAAQTDYKAMLLDWIARHPDASLAEIMQKQAEFGELVLRGIIVPEDQSAQRSYQRPGAAEGALPQSPFAGQRTESTVQPGPAEAAEIQVTDYTRSQADDWMARVPAERRAEIESAARYAQADVRDVAGRAIRESAREWFAGAPDNAKEALRQAAQAKGLTEEALVVSAYMDRLRQAVDIPELPKRRPEPPAPKAAEPPPSRDTDTDEERDFLVTPISLTDDNNPSRPLFDVIASAESGASGYNGKFGYKRGLKGLTDKTVDEVLAMPAKGGSSASGRYQIIDATLKRLKTEMGLTGKEKFTPELQDRMALKLAEEAGLSRWQAGKISDQRFANNLAKVWAGLPVVSGKNKGKSYYSGDGLNEATVGVQEVLAALRKIKGGLET